MSSGGGRAQADSALPTSRIESAGGGEVMPAGFSGEHVGYSGRQTAASSSYTPWVPLGSRRRTGLLRT
jgi:hypothetical protein